MSKEEYNRELFLLMVGMLLGASAFPIYLIMDMGAIETWTISGLVVAAFLYLIAAIFFAWITPKRKAVKKE